MLSWFLVCSLLVTFASAKPSIVVPSDIVGLLIEKSVECIAETGADAHILQRVFNWQFDDEEKSKKFVFCMFIKSGFSYKTGHFDVDKTLDLYVKSDKKQQVRDAAAKCDKINEKNPVDTMHKIIQCFFEKTPVLLEVNLDQ